MSKVKLILIALPFFFNSCWSSDKNSAAGVAAIATIWTWRDIFAEPRRNSFKPPVILMPQIVWDYRFQCWVQILVPAKPY